MRCIFCLRERPESDEHVFPLAIGGILVTKRVCKPCNDELGSRVDSPLTDHIMVQMVRDELGLKGNSGSVPSAFLQLMRGAGLASDQSRKLDFSLDAEGKLTAKHRTKVYEKTLEDGTKVKHAIIDASRPEEAIKIANRARKKEGLRPMTEAEKVALLAQIPKAIQTIDKPELISKVKVDLVSFQPALAKIAYELAFIWLGEAYLDTESASSLRHTVLSPPVDLEKPGKIRVFFGEPAPLRPFGSTERDHLGIANLTNGIVMVTVRIFNLFWCVANVATADEARLSIAWPGRFISINAQTGETRESTFMEAVEKGGGTRTATASNT